MAADYKTEYKTVNVNAEIHKRVKRVCVESEESINQFYDRIALKELKKKEEEYGLLGNNL